MLGQGQKSLAREIEQTIACCGKKNCDDPLWDEVRCQQCGQQCSEACSYYLEAINRNMRENRWYDGKFPIRRLPKGDWELSPEIGVYVALADTPSWKKGDSWKAGEQLFLERKHCYFKPLEEKKVAQ